VLDGRERTMDLDSLRIERFATASARPETVMF
jgi:hypothetical protein